MLSDADQQRQVEFDALMKKYKDLQAVLDARDRFVVCSFFFFLFWFCV